MKKNTQNHETQKSIKNVQHIKLREHSARLPAKMNMILFQPWQNTAHAAQNARAQIHW